MLPSTFRKATMLLSLALVAALLVPSAAQAIPPATAQIVKIAGGGTNPNTTGTPANSARALPTDIATDKFGNIFWEDTGYEIVQVLARSATDPGYLAAGSTWTPGNAYVIAGLGGTATSANGVIATNALLSNTVGVAVDPNNNVLIANGSNLQVLAVGVTKPAYIAAGVTWTTGKLYTVATQTGTVPSTTGVAVASSSIAPVGVTTDANGNVFIADNVNNLVDVIAASATDPGYLTGGATWTPGNVYALAGGGATIPSSTGTASTAATIGPKRVVVDANHNVIVADLTNKLVEVLALGVTDPGYLAGGATWTRSNVYRIVGNTLNSPGTTTSGVSALGVTETPRGLALDANGNVVVQNSSGNVDLLAVATQKSNYLVAGTTWTHGSLYTIGGLQDEVPNPSTTPAPATTRNIFQGRGMAIGTAGNIVIGENAQVDEIVAPPDPPTGVSATVANGQASVSFTPPSNNGGSAITNYVVTSSPGGFTASGVASPISVTGLTNGTSYMYTVRATNSIGTSTESVASSSVSPAMVATAPQNLVATPGNSQVSLAWDAPASNGGAAVTGYIVEYSLNGSSWTTAFVSTASPAIVVSLTGGTPYQFRVSAINIQGAGAQITTAATPLVPVISGVVPTSPTAVSANAGIDNATISWSAPASNGGSAVTSYMLQFRKVGASTWTAASSNATGPTVVSGLTASTLYEVQVIAVNGIGASPAAWQQFTTLTIPSPGISAPLHLSNDGSVTTVPQFSDGVPDAVAVAGTPTGQGSWTLGSDGGVFTAGDAGFFGSSGGARLNSPMVGIAPTPSANGYYLVGADGGVFAFGDANFDGSMASHPLNAPITAMTSTCSNHGYYLIANDGGVFAFGDASFHGSMAGLLLNQGMIGIVAPCAGGGYWTYAADGGVFTFGNAKFYGSLGSNPPGGGVIGMVSAPDGKGYWLIGADKKAYGFGSVAN